MRLNLANSLAIPIVLFHEHKFGMEIIVPKDNSGILKKLELNASQAKCLMFLSMLYVSTMLCNAVLTNKWISMGNHFVFGGAFVSPLLFIMSDVIAELFGYKIARQVIWFAFICQTLFAIITEIMISTPSPENWHQQSAYVFVFGSLIRIDLSGFIAFITSSLVNIRFITKWKIMFMGQYFWLRSFGSSAIAEALYSAIAIIMIGFGSLPFSTMLSIVLITFCIKAVYSIILAYPGNILVNYLKHSLKIDVYESGSDAFLSSLKRIKNSYDTN